MTQPAPTTRHVFAEDAREGGGGESTGTDTTVKAVTFEGSAALVGPVLAAVGLALEQLTGRATWNGIAALAIGVLLLVAGSLARADVPLLVGQPLPRRLEDELCAEVAGLPQVVGVPVLCTTVIGPGRAIVSAEVDLADDVTVADIERARDEAERRLVARYPGCATSSSPTPRPATGGPGGGAPAGMSRSGPPLARPVRIEVWSDVVCPWCYIGKRRLEAALARFPHRDEVEVVWRSFQLDPGIPEGETHATLPALAAKVGRPVEDVRAMMRHVEETAAGEGLHYDLANGVSGNTLPAHEVVHLAAERGLQGAVKERLLHAHFEEGRSVFDVDSLAALAEEAGLDEAEVRAALADHRYRPAVLDDTRTARELGATGVPFSVVDRRYGAAGAQPADLLLQLLQQAWADASPAAARA